MLTPKPYDDIGLSDLGWLKGKQHFAIGRHGNPAHRALGNLIVLNDDEIAPASGFPLHGHTDLEIVTYVREGVITHEDDLGNKGRTEAGDVQVMSTGDGIRHAEYNEGEGPTRMFQIWLSPRRSGGPPNWSARKFPKAARSGQFVTLASGYDAPDALPIRADAEVLGAVLAAGAKAPFAIRPGHGVYIVPSKGAVSVNGVRLEALSGLSVVDEASVEIEAAEDAELVLIVAKLAPADPGVATR